MSCEQFFSKMKMVDSVSTNQLDRERLVSCIQVATSHIRQNICEDGGKETVASFSLKFLHPPK
jgi:hypothetical protein